MLSGLEMFTFPALDEMSTANSPKIVASARRQVTVVFVAMGVMAFRAGTKRVPMQAAELLASSATSRCHAVLLRSRRYKRNR